MHTYEEVCKMIACRLQTLLEREDPLTELDEYIEYYEQSGETALYPSQLEELWLLKTADRFNDRTLAALIEVRNQMYWLQVRYTNKAA